MQVPGSWANLADLRGMGFVRVGGHSGRVVGLHQRPDPLPGLVLCSIPPHAADARRI